MPFTHILHRVKISVDLNLEHNPQLFLQAGLQMGVLQYKDVSPDWRHSCLFLESHELTGELDDWQQDKEENES